MRFEVLLRTSGRRLEREGFRVDGDPATARSLAAYILGTPEDLVVLAVAG